MEECKRPEDKRPEDNPTTCRHIHRHSDDPHSHLIAAAHSPLSAEFHTLLVRSWRGPLSDEQRMLSATPWRGVILHVGDLLRCSHSALRRYLTLIQDNLVVVHRHHGRVDNPYRPSGGQDWDGLKLVSPARSRFCDVCPLFHPRTIRPTRKIYLSSNCPRP